LVAKKRCKRLTDSSHHQKDATILPHKANFRPDGLFGKDRAKLRALVEGAARASTALKLE
jgi:hypothetical protein